MNKINYKIARAESLIQQALEDLPIGVAYYIMRSQTTILQNLYWKQVQIESQELDIQEQQTENQEEMDQIKQTEASIEQAEDLVTENE